MTPKTKSESPQHLVEAIDRLERQSDSCNGGLQLLRRYWNYAAWLSLTECVRQIDSSLAPAEYGSGRHKILVMNLARAACQMWRFARQHSKRAQCPPSEFRWYPKVAEECGRAFQVAAAYSMFCIDFPAWHRGLHAAEIVDATTIRFHSGSSELARRVSAYQKGIRPRAFTSIAKSSLELPSLTQALKLLFDEAVVAAKGPGRLADNFGATKTLRTALAGMYAERLSGVLRRYQNISVGHYDLEEFRQFYGGLLAIVGAHEHLCFLWSKRKGVPFQSLVLVDPQTTWVKLIAEYSGLATERVSRILPDLILGTSPSQDLQMTPFVSLSGTNSILAVAPAFPLQSNWEENILRVCSFLRPNVYSQTSLSKEVEMRDQLRSAVALPRRLSGPVNLGSGTPDLDLVIEDSAAEAVVLAELKWPRKPYSPREFPERDSELRKGVKQIKAIKLFLTANPGFLADRGYLAKPISDYRHVQYCVISRDHLIGTEDKEFPIYGFDVFESEISQPKEMISILTFLNSMDWLPREGEDFTCQWVNHTAGGVTVSSEVFSLKTPGAALTT